MPYYLLLLGFDLYKNDIIILCRLLQLAFLTQFLLWRFIYDVVVNLISIISDVDAQLCD